MFTWAMMLTSVPANKGWPSHTTINIETGYDLRTSEGRNAASKANPDALPMQLPELDAEHDYKHAGEKCGTPPHAAS